MTFLTWGALGLLGVSLRESNCFISKLYFSHYFEKRSKFPFSSMCVLVNHLCLTLCDPLDYSPPGSSVHGDSPARILEWVAFPSSRGSSQPRDNTWVSCIAGGFFIIGAPGEALLKYEKVPLTLVRQLFMVYQE